MKTLPFSPFTTTALFDEASALGRTVAHEIAAMRPGEALIATTYLRAVTASDMSLAWAHRIGMESERLLDVAS